MTLIDEIMSTPKMRARLKALRRSYREVSASEAECDELRLGIEVGESALRVIGRMQPEETK